MILVTQAITDYYAMNVFEISYSANIRRILLDITCPYSSSLDHRVGGN